MVTAEEEVSIISHFDLRLSAGQSLSLTGVSGSGKSTVLGLLAGLDRPTQGSVSLFGVNLNTLSEDGRAKIRAGRVGFIFQSFHLLPTLNVLDNVLMPMELLSLPDAKSRAIEVLDEVGLQHRLRHYPAQLSGGEQQRVAIARAFVIKPQILFADEPTGNLDKQSAQRVSQLLFYLQQRQETAIVLATHDRQLSECCDRHIDLGTS